MYNPKMMSDDIEYHMGMGSHLEVAKCKIISKAASSRMQMVKIEARKVDHRADEKRIWAC